MIKLNLGCGKDIKKGFINCDIQRYPGVDKVFDCSNLKVFKNDSADFIFCHSFFEHLYLYQQYPFLNECYRVLTDSGYLLVLGIPDFHAISKAYIRSLEGVAPFGGTFDLYQAYRLTHGDFEGNSRANIPQMHKTIFDNTSLSNLLKQSKFPYFNIFNYKFPGEYLELAIGFFAKKEKTPFNKLPEDLQNLINEYTKEKIKA